MDKKAPRIQDSLDEFNRDLLDSKKYSEAEGAALDNQSKRIEIKKKEHEIKILQNQLRDYKLTRAAAWLGFISSLGLLILKLIEWFGTQPSK